MSDLATILLLLRLRAFATTEAVAEATGTPPDVVERLLSESESHRLVQHRSGRIDGWTLTAAGRRHGQELLVAEMEAAGARAAVTDAYLDFLPLNAELLSICTDWQVVDQGGEHVPNDHSDPLRDAAVLRRLDELHPAAMRVTDALSAALGRFSGYGPRLTDAHLHVAAGRTEWLSGATSSSYHGVWFELHEHLLTVLGHERTREPIPAYTPTIPDDTSRPPQGAPRNGDVP